VAYFLGHPYMPTVCIKNIHGH